MTRTVHKVRQRRTREPSALVLNLYASLCTPDRPSMAINCSGTRVPIGQAQYETLIFYMTLKRTDPELLTRRIVRNNDMDFLPEARLKTFLAQLSISPNRAKCKTPWHEPELRRLAQHNSAEHEMSRKTFW